MTQAAAALIDKDYKVEITSNWYFLCGPRTRLCNRRNDGL
jgi:p-aminobenzoyl-glutamate transporter AbgT